jgi:hypothetical protein
MKSENNISEWRIIVRLLIINIISTSFVSYGLSTKSAWVVGISALVTMLCLHFFIPKANRLLRVDISHQHESLTLKRMFIQWDVLFSWMLLLISWLTVSSEAVRFVGMIIITLGGLYLNKDTDFPPSAFIDHSGIRLNESFFISRQKKVVGLQIFLKLLVINAVSVGLLYYFIDYNRQLLVLIGVPLTLLSFAVFIPRLSVLGSNDVTMWFKAFVVGEIFLYNFFLAYTWASSFDGLARSIGVGAIFTIGTIIAVYKRLR